MDKRKVFLNNKDYRRFFYSIKDFNDKNSSINLFRRVSVSGNTIDVGNRISHKIVDREPLVEIVSFCLMPNHFHFILRQIEDWGVSRFMQKMGIGYTNYFNQKYERNGVLFQGKFKAVLIDRDAYLNYLKQYVYLNPLDIIEPGWKEAGLKNWRKAKKFLESYRWTDCKDYNEYDEFLVSCKKKASFGDIKEYIID
ncbi:transposase [Patescibacteria group bacterium]|nr:transposase [Patescibacteria group bacterium]